MAAPPDVICYPGPWSETASAAIGACATMSEQSQSLDLLVRQREYFQYLFEQEQKRAASIVAGAKIHIAFLVFILGSILLRLIRPEKILPLFTDSNIGAMARCISVAMVVLSGIALTGAVFFTFFVMKVWSYDRLCDPIERLGQTLLMKDEIEVLSKSIADFAVATDRNNHVNNKRAEYLTRGLKCLVFGTLLSIITSFVLNLLA